MYQVTPVIILLIKACAILTSCNYNFNYSIVHQVSPIYIGEISPECLRGRLLSFINITSTFGYTVSEFSLSSCV